MKSIILALIIFLPWLLQGQSDLDYSDQALWAALPTKFDSADLTPIGYMDLQSEAIVDVFFIHPTS